MTSTSPRQTKAEAVRAHIERVISGGLAPHDKLPTERDLADQLEVSRLTVRRALDQLERDGAVYRIQGAGTFVGDTTIAKTIELTSFSEDMRARGLMPGSQPVIAEVVAAGPRVAHTLGLSAEDLVVHFERVRTADSTPMCIEHSYLPSRLAPGIERQLGARSLYEVLASDFGVHIEYADQTIRATLLDPTTAGTLGATAFGPAFQVSRTAFDERGRAIEYAESLYRGDRYSYELTIHRIGRR